MTFYRYIECVCARPALAANDDHTEGVRCTRCAGTVPARPARATFHRVIRPSSGMIANASALAMAAS